MWKEDKREKEKIEEDKGEEDKREDDKMKKDKVEGDKKGPQRRTKSLKQEGERNPRISAPGEIISLHFAKHFPPW